METETVKSTRRNRRAIVLSVLIPVILLSGLHFFVTYKAKQLLPTIVAKMSEGKYTMTSQKFSFSYFSPYLKLYGVHLYPKVSDLDEEYHVRIDSFSLSIESIVPIFFNKSINVKDIRLVNPSVIIKRNKKVDKQPVNNDDIHMKVSNMQNNAIMFLNELSVNSFDIVNGSFRFFPFHDNNRNFNIEHVDLAIKDLVIPPYEGTRTAGIDGKIKLSIKDPRISIPDSLLDVQMDNFVWDNQERYLNIGNFMISQKSVPPRADSFLIALDTIRLRQMYWNTWLDSGILRVDTVIANNGNMYFESSGSSNGKSKRKPTDTSQNIRTLKVWDAIGDLDLNYFSARYINAAIINRNPGQERSNSVIGDSLIIQYLSVRPERKDPLMIGDLGLGVREFVDRGTNNKFQSSFSRMKLKGDTMVLNNYFVQSTPQSRMGKGSSLFIPTLTIDGLSIEDLMAEKASVREVRMDRPQLVLLADLEAENTNGIRLSRKTLEEIKPYVDVERVILNDAKFTINNKRRKGYSLGTQEFSAVILSRSAIQAKDMDGLMSSVRNVNLKRFFYVTPTAQMELFDGTLDYNNKVLRFEKVTGFMGNKKIYADLRGVELIGDPRLQPFDNDVIWHLKKLGVDSGAIRVTMGTSNASTNDDPNKLLGLIDSLDLRNISIKLVNKKMEAGAYITRARVEGQKIYTKKYMWGQNSLSLQDIHIKTDKIDVKSSSAEILSKGNSTFTNAQIKLKNGTMDLSVKAPKLFMTSNFSTIDPNNISIDNIRLSDPVIDLDMRDDSTAAKTTSAPSRKFELKKFDLDRPQFSLIMHGQNRVTRLFGDGESFDGTGMLFNKTDSIGLFSMESFKTVLNNLKMDDGDNETFKTGKISLETGQYQKYSDRPGVIDLKSFQVGAMDVNHSWKRDTMEAKTGGITLGYIPRLILQKDSLIQAAFKIPPANVLPSTFVFRTPEKKFSIQNFRVNTASQFLEWDSLEVQNRISRDSFFAHQPFEKDYITFSIGKFRADALRPVVYNKDTAVYVRKLTVDPLNFKVERDKRVPDDTVTYRPLMTRMLNKLPFLLKVDTIHLLKSLVWHNVIDEKTEKEGTIYFTNISGYLTNVKNFDLGSNGDSLRLNVTSRLMGAGDLRVQFREAYNDSLQGFLLAARMDAMDMKELNRLMTPLFNVRIDRGKIRDLSMRVKGTDVLAFGNMEINYDKLRVSVLTKENKRRDMVSWLANLFVRGKNSKTGIVYAERLREKSIFNYWARISVNGLLTNLGVKQNGKQVRRFYKGLEKNQLPPDLF